MSDVERICWENQENVKTEVRNACEQAERERSRQMAAAAWKKQARKREAMKHAALFCAMLVGVLLVFTVLFAAGGRAAEAVTACMLMVGAIALGMILDEKLEVYHG